MENLYQDLQVSQHESFWYHAIGFTKEEVGRIGQSTVSEYL